MSAPEPTSSPGRPCPSSARNGKHTRLPNGHVVRCAGHRGIGFQIIPARAAHFAPHQESENCRMRHLCCISCR
jgi:hypothetical protein